TVKEFNGFDVSKEGKIAVAYKDVPTGDTSLQGFLSTTSEKNREAFFDKFGVYQPNLNESALALNDEKKGRSFETKTKITKPEFPSLSFAEFTVDPNLKLIAGGGLTGT